MNSAMLIRVIRHASTFPWMGWLAFVFFLGLPAIVQGQVVLNEIMANNVTTLANRAGLFSDWVELYNSGGGIVNLGGYTLSDNPSNVTKFSIPANTFLGPG